MEESQFEDQLSQLYDENKMIKCEPMFISIEVKPLLDKLDLKKEVVLTMLNQLD